MDTFRLDVVCYNIGIDIIPIKNICNFAFKCDTVSLSISRRHVKCLKYLLECIHSVSSCTVQNCINIQTNLDDTLLHFFARGSLHGDEIENIEMLHILMEYGSDINCKGPGGNTPLHLLIEHYRVGSSRSENILKAFLKLNPNPYIKNNKKYTPMDIAILLNRDSCYAILKEYVEKYNMLFLIKEPCVE